MVKDKKNGIKVRSKMVEEMDNDLEGWFERKRRIESLNDWRKRRIGNQNDWGIGRIDFKIYRDHKRTWKKYNEHRAGRLLRQRRFKDTGKKGWDKKRTGKSNRRNSGRNLRKIWNR